MGDIEKTLEERGARYGDFADHAKIAQTIQDDMRATKGWEKLSPSQKQALTTISDKIARILNGDPQYADNWHDIAGYASLVDKQLINREEANRNRRLAEAQRNSLAS